MGRFLATALTLAALLAPARAQAFSVITSGLFFGVRQSLEQTARWDANPAAPASLADGIQVAVEPGFAAALGITDPGQVAALHDAILASLGVWDNGGLTFDVTFDGAVAEGTLAGAELDIMTVPSGDPRLCGSIAGCTWWEYEWSSTRQLTNGQTVPGYAIAGIDVFIDYGTFKSLFATAGFDATLLIFQRTLIHEVGHGIGLHHPTDPDAINYDTDFDPLNDMPVDPFDPAAGFLVSPNVDCTAIMVNNAGICDASAFIATSLYPDDRGGRDVLYPVIPAVPEPAPLALGLAAAAALRRRAVRRPAVA